MTDDKIEINVEAIQRRLDTLGKNHAWLADESGVSKSTISLIFSGARPNVSAVVLGKLAVALECTTDELLGLTQPKYVLPAAVKELLGVAQQMPDIRQQDLLHIAQGFLAEHKEGSGPMARMMEAVLEAVQERFGDEAVDALADDLAARLPPPLRTRRRRTRKQLDESSDR